jgi:phosphoribosylanthranilate isomerase
MLVEEALALIVQIYAFTDPDEARLAAQIGVDHIGFVAGDYGLVPGELSFVESRALVEALPPEVTAVALTMATDVDEIVRMARFVRPQIVHISTDMQDVDLSKMKSIRAKLPEGIRLMKAISVTDESSVEAARYYAQESDLLLLDTKSASIAGIGVSGKTHDWNISRRIVESVRIPVILAGGLSAENAAEALRMVQPFGVDSNTHTNLAGELVSKDMDRILAFVQAVRAAEKFMEGN